MVALREQEHAPFAAIADALRLTPAKAQRVYGMFYQEKVIQEVEALQNKAPGAAEKQAIWDRYVRGLSLIHI